MSYCKINKIKLLILPWSTTRLQQKSFRIRKKYYKRVLGNNEFKIMKKISLTIVTSYHLNIIIISFNSTMAYELLSRNYSRNFTES